MNKVKITLASLAALPLFTIGVTMAVTNAFALTPYQSGYNHGVSDAKGGDYILQPGKGFAFHTHEFNQGYIDGWCSVEGPGSSSDADQATFDCSTDASK